jgi:hypothetical protein
LQDDRESAADPEDKIAVSSSLLRFVMHPSHEVRVAALKNLVTLFTSQANDIKIQVSNNFFTWQKNCKKSVGNHFNSKFVQFK